MEKSTNVFDIMKSRTSVRSYLKRSIDADLQDKILETSAGLEPGPNNSDIRFEWVASTSEDPELLRELGTYGVIKNPAGFFVGAVNSLSNGMLDFGFQMERMVLHLAEMGLGTCWLGASFKKSRFAKAVDLSEEEMIPAVLSVGYPADKRSGRERVMRWACKSDQRKSWSVLFFNENFDQPLSREQVGHFSDILEGVRWAPSATNKQPWRIVRCDTGKTFHFFLERDPRYTKTMAQTKMADLQMVDMGIGLCHFLVAMNAIGIKGGCLEDPPHGISCPENTEYVISWKKQESN